MQNYFNKILSAHNHIILLLLIFLNNTADARYLTPKEAPYTLELLKKTLFIKADGSTKSQSEEIYLINNEHGREQLSTFTVNFYSPRNIKVLEAKTIIGDMEYIVPSNQIEVKPLASSEQGFDQAYQILISFSRVVVGAKLYLKLEESYEKSIIDGHYSESISFGHNQHVISSIIEINSEITNLRFLLEDKHNKLNVEEFISDYGKKLTISLKEPVYFELANEPEINYLDMQEIPRIFITTIPSFEYMSQKIATRYEEAINSHLPPFLLSLYEQAKTIENDYDKINFITSQINTNIRYMGSWNTIDGQWYPRSLEIIEQSGYADCKEYTIAVAAIMKNLGFKVYSALIYRSDFVDVKHPTIPVFELFNHAIVYAKNDSGQEFWIDPTNFVSDSSDIFSDISDRYSLVLDPKNGGLKYTPRSKVNQLVHNSEFYLGENTGQHKGNMIFKNQSSHLLTGQKLRWSEEYLKDFFISSFLLDLDKDLPYEIEMPSLNDRIARDITVNFKYKFKNPMTQSNLGMSISPGFLLSDSINLVFFFRNYQKNWQGFAYLGPRKIYKNYEIYKNFYATNLEKLNFSMSNKWFDFSRKFYIKNKDLILEEILEQKESIIHPNENIKEIQLIQKELVKNCTKKLVIKQETNTKIPSIKPAK